MGEQSSSAGQTITLPTGGGALRGIGETFTPDLHTGTANFSVPITVPRGRHGLDPKLTLGYSSGNGNGPFGMGWGLGVPAISRKTARGVPRYDSSLDVFVMSGTEDLVRVEEDAQRVRYRPRTEGAFARIERRRTTVGDYWEVCTLDGLVNLYGARSLTDGTVVVEPGALVRDPRRPDRIFTWALSETRDPFGNRIEYAYTLDAPADPDRRDEAERRGHVWANRLLDRIDYVDWDDGGTKRFLVSIVLEYEDRPDPFSTYRSGFEVRSSRRAKRIVARTHADPARPQGVRAYELVYLDERRDLADLEARLPANGVTHLSRIRVHGYDDNTSTADGLPRDEHAPLDFGYTAFTPASRRFRVVEGDALPLRSLSSADYELVDLSGDGLPDILELNGTARYWENLGGHYDVPRSFTAVPAGVALADRDVQLLDANGDGRADLLVGRLGGYYPLSFRAAWDQRSFQRYDVMPAVDLGDPELRFVDLDGDGLTDIARSGTRLECYFNSAPRRDAWKRSRRIARRNNSVFPNVRFSDPRVRLADVNGDGLQDIVFVHDGDFVYWPSIGHGEWAEPIHMERSPRLRPDMDPRRLLVGDVDGDGLADAVFVEDRRVTLWMNHAGNSFGDPIVISGTPTVSDVDAVRLVDLDGTGVGGILWSRDSGPSGRRNSLLFLDLTGGTKPYLLNNVDNNMGAVTRVEYRSSTRDCRADATRAETRWKTALPFPVHVLGRIETLDRISGSKTVSEYRYHHGYWDGREREFRGFGRVDQRDAETRDGGPPDRHFSPPLETRTWFHLGSVETDVDDWSECSYTDEYWSEDAEWFERPPETAALLRGLPPPARRDALRGLRGSMLRTELYALDGSQRRNRPYTVTESAYGICEVVDTAGGTLVSGSTTPAGASHATRIFYPHLRATRTTQWERGDDPMTAITYLDDYDAFGRPTEQTTVALPRRSARRVTIQAAQVGAIQPDETKVLATHSRTTYASPAPVFPRLYVHDRPAHVTSFALEQPPTVTETAPQNLPLVLREQAAAAADVRETFRTALSQWRIGDLIPAAVQLLSHTLHHYDGAGFAGRTDSQLGPYGALTRSESLVFRDVELDAAYGNRRPQYLGGAAPVPAGAPAGFGTALGYRRMPAQADAYCDGYYVDTTNQQRDFQAGVGENRGMVVATRDALGRQSDISLDRHWLLPVTVTDPVKLATSAEYSYRVFQPERVTDANGHATVYEYSALGLLSRVWLKPRGGGGGTRDRPEVRYDYAFRNYELTRATPAPQPVFVHTTQRVNHAADNVSDDVVQTREYSDGFGRLVQTRVGADDVVFGTPTTAAPFTGEDVGLPLDATTTPSPALARKKSTRVRVAGSESFDNKGRVVEKFEPFFSDDWDFERGGASRGASITLTYDPRGQPINIVHPDGSERRVMFGTPVRLADPTTSDPTPWETYLYDANDLDGFRAGPRSPTTRAAPAVHRLTPTSRVLDARGRVVCAVERNGPQATTDWFATRSRFDVRGNLVETLDPLGRSALRHAYDLTDRVLGVKSIDAGLRTSVLDANGEIVEYRDSKGSVELRLYDSVGRLEEIWARDRRGQAVTLRERLAYGDGGDPNQPSAARTANRVANRLGRLSSHRDEAGLLQLERYDFKGNLLEKTRRVVSDATIAQGWTADWSAVGADGDLDPTDYTIATAYDALDRPTRITLPEESRPRAAGGMPTRAVLEFEFNPAGAVRRVRLDSQDYVSWIAYNAKGERVLVAYGNGLMTRHVYDPSSYRLARTRTEQFTQPHGPYVWEGQGQPLQDQFYSYDPSGNVTAIEDWTPRCGVQGTALGQNRLRRDFEYDPLYRLVSATGRACLGTGSPRTLDSAGACGGYPGPYAPGPPTPNQNNAPSLTELYTETYEHDPAGNLLELTYAAASGSWSRRFGLGGTAPGGWANAPSNRVTTMVANPATHTFAFDENGNTRRQNADRLYSWDHADRLTRFRVQSAASTSVDARYLYGADGGRVKKWVRKGASTVADSTVYVSGIFEHRRWQESGTAKEQNHIHVTDERSRVAIVRLGDVDKDDAGPAIQYHLGDHLGSSSVVARDDGLWINREEYFPHGETSFGSFARKRYRFAGKERDEESALSYHGARYLAPYLGRWISCDRVRIPDSASTLNSYSFVEGSPLVFRDPTGHQQAAGYLASDEPEKGFFEGFGEKLKQDLVDAPREWLREHFDPGGPDATGPPAAPQPLSKDALVRQPPPPPKLRVTVWKPVPNEFERQVAELKLSVKGVAATADMAFTATDYLFPHYAAVSLVPGLERRAAGLALEEATALEAQSRRLAGAIESRATSSAAPTFAQWYAKYAAKTPPAQISGKYKIGPAYKSMDEAVANLPHPEAHLAQVTHKDASGRVVNTWWEVSESGLPGRVGDTEQKALRRVELKPGETLEIKGWHPPCPYQCGCHTIMEDTAITTGADIHYTAVSPSGEQSERWYQGGVGYIPRK
jgi:RHS repeat-associated protein